MPMQVVLLERIEKLGQMGDVVRVKNGFARNYLLPQGKALRSTAENMKRFERQRAELEARNLERRSEAESVAGRMADVSCVLVRSASDMGQLYGSVNARDIAESLTTGGYKVERRQIVLDRPIKTLGLHQLRVALHPEVSITVTVNVARSEQEAALQARGIDVLAEPADDEDEAEAEPEAPSAEAAAEPEGAPRD
jgi:large subunit ribosomal protein L9